MLWDESSFPNTSGPVNTTMTVKVRVLDGQGLIGKGRGQVAGRSLRPGEPFTPFCCVLITLPFAGPE